MKETKPSKAIINWHANICVDGVFQVLSLVIILNVKRCLSSCLIFNFLYGPHFNQFTKSAGATSTLL